MKRVEPILLLSLLSCSDEPEHRVPRDAALFRVEARGVLEALAAPDCSFAGSLRQRISKAEVQLKALQFRTKAARSVYARDFEIAKEDAMFFPVRVECDQPLESYRENDSIRRDQYIIERMQKSERLLSLGN